MISKVLWAVMGMTLAIGAQSSSANASGKVSSCRAQSDEYRYRSSDGNFRVVAERINTFFSPGGNVKVGVPGVPTGDVVRADTEILIISTEIVVCESSPRSRNSRGALPTVTTSDCNYVGCVEDLGPDYSDMPPGSTVKISTCSNNVQTERRYTKSSSGNWVLLEYSTVYVEECRLT